MKTKKEIREDIKNIFQSTNKRGLETLNHEIGEKLYTHVSHSKAKNIAVYESMDDEVSLSEVIQKLESEGCNILFPQIISETEIIFIDSEFDVYEKEIDIFIIPGRAFSIDGKRLGRGKGYYDRFLSQKIYKASQKIGTCYDFQVREDVPTQKHDISMNLIITND